MNELLLHLSTKYRTEIEKEMNDIVDRVEDLKSQLTINNFDELNEIIKEQKNDYEILKKILNYNNKEK